MADFDWTEAMAKIDGGKSVTVKLPPPKPVSKTPPKVKSGTTWEWPDDMSQFLPNEDAHDQSIPTLLNRNAKLFGESAGRGLIDTVPYILDILNAARFSPLNTGSELKDSLLGSGTLTSSANRWYDDRYTTVHPQTKWEEFVASLGGGAGAGLPAGGLGVISGLSGGLGGQVAHEAFPNSEWAPLIGSLIGGIAPEGALVVKGRAANAHMIRSGAAHPNYGSLIDTIIDLEGGGTLANPKFSKKGAMGVMQVMPDTARKPGFGIRPWNGKTQEDLARVGRQYAAALNGKYAGDEAKVLAAYNAGPGKVDSLVHQFGNNWWKHLNDETKKYLQNGLNKLDGVNRGRGVRPMSPDEIASATGDNVSALPEDAVAPADGQISGYDTLPEEAALLNKALEPNDNVVAFPEENIKGRPDELLQKASQGESLTNKEQARLNEAGFVRSVVDGRWLPREEAYAEAHQLWADKNFPEGTVVHGFDPLNPANDTAPKDVITQRELQDMPAAMREQYLREAPNSEPLTEAPSPPKKTLKDLLDDEEGAFRPFGRNPDDIKQNPNPDLTDEITRVSSYNADGKTVPAIRVFDKNTNETFSFTRRRPFEKKEDWLTRAYEAAKRIINDEEGVFRPFGRDKGNTQRPKKSTNPGYEDLSPVEKLLKGIKETKPASAERRRAIHEARQRQDAILETMQNQGAGYKEQLASIKGQVPGADFESIAQHFNPEDVSHLEQLINKSPRLRRFEKLSTLRSLHNLLDPEGVKMPTERELRNLSDVLGPSVWSDVAKRTRLDGPADVLLKTVNSSKTAQASIDVSGASRQAFPFVARKAFWNSLPAYFKTYYDRVIHGKNVTAYDKYMESIKDMDTYPEMKQAGVSFTGRGFSFSGEDYFQGSYAEAIPIYGTRLIKGSDDGYSGYLNLVRAKVFDTLYKQKIASGGVWTRDQLKELGEYVNTGTGRGSIFKFLRSSKKLLDAAFWSTSLQASRMKLLSPHYAARLYAKDKFLFKQYARDMAGMIAVSASMLSAATLMFPGVTIETDPRSTDFLKIKVGNRRYDVLGSFQPYLRLAVQELTGEKKNVNTGEIKPLGANPLGMLIGQDQTDHYPGFGDETRMTVLGNFFGNKLAPLPSLFLRYMEQNKYQKLDWPLEAAKLGVPMWFPDVYTETKTNGAAPGAGIFAPNFIGWGVQDYEPPKPKASNSTADDPFGDTGFDNSGGFDNDPFAGTGF